MDNNGINIGIVFFMLHVICGILMNCFLKTIDTTIMVFLISLLFILTALSLGLFILYNKFDLVPKNNLSLHVIRGILGCITEWLHYASLAILPMTHITVAYRLVPIFEILFNKIIQRERWGYFEYCMCLISLISFSFVIIVERHNLHWKICLSIFNALLYAIQDIIIKITSRNTNDNTSIFFFVLCVCCGFVVLQLFNIVYHNKCSVIFSIDGIYDIWYKFINIITVLSNNILWFNWYYLFVLFCCLILYYFCQKTLVLALANTTFLVLLPLRYSDVILCTICDVCIFGIPIQSNMIVFVSIITILCMSMLSWYCHIKKKA